MQSKTILLHPISGRAADSGIDDYSYLASNNSFRVAANIRLVVYDSTCVMCSNFIRFLDLIYAGSQLRVIVAPSVDALIKDSPTIDPDFSNMLNKTAEKSIILLKESGIDTKSRAIYELLIDSNNLVLALIARLCKAVIPLIISDFVYDKVAGNRYLFSRSLPKNCSLRLRNIYRF